MAGAGWRSFTAGAVLTAAQVQTYLQDQTVMKFADASARSSALGTAVSAGMVSYRADGTVVEYYNGSSWQDFTAHAPARNAIINGAFDVWQRGTSFTTTGYTADRWNFLKPGSSTITVSRQSFTPGTAPVSGYEGSYFLRLDRTSSAGSSDWLEQKIEDVRTFAGQTVTISFWAKASAAFTPTKIYLSQNFGSGGSAQVDTAITPIALTTSWARYTYTATVPSIAGKTIGTNSFLDLVFEFAVALGNITFDIWGVQLEAGSTATPFRTNGANPQAELAACQRYYYRVEAINSYVGLVSGRCVSSTNSRFEMVLPVSMRIVPTSITTSAANKFFVADGVTNTFATSLTFGGASKTTISWDAAVASGLTTYRPINITIDGVGTTSFFAVDVEL